MKCLLIGSSSVLPFFRSSVQRLLIFGFMLTIFLVLSCQKNETEQNRNEISVMTEIRGDEVNDPNQNPWWDQDGPDWDQLSESCTPSGIFTECNPTNPITVFLTIQLPQYPGCTFQVAFKYTTCYLPQPTVLISDYVMGYVYCANFQSDLYNSTLPNGIGFGQFIYNIDQQIYEKIEQYVIGNIQSAGAPEPCYTLAFYKSACYMYCYGTNIRNQFVVRKKPCGDNACCKRSVDYCNGIANGAVEQEVIDNGTCSQVIPPAGLCEGILNPNPAPECYFTCDQ
jgi:hypothetical protein